MEEVSSCEHTTTCRHHHHSENKHSHNHWWWWWAGPPPPPEELVFAMSFVMVTLLWQLPMEYIDENPVPTVIFHGHPTTFHIFVLGLCFSFSGSVGAIELRRREPKLAWYYRSFGVSAMAVTVAVLLWAAVPAGFCFICSVMQSWPPAGVFGLEWK